MEDLIPYENLTSIRVGKVSPILTEKKPSLIPFKGKFPLVPALEYATFLKEIAKENDFDNLPRFIKRVVYKAELILDYDTRFKAYLSQRNITEKDFEAKNPKTKFDTLLDWMFSEQLDEGFLNM